MRASGARGALSVQSRARSSRRVRIVEGDSDPSEVPKKREPITPQLSHLTLDAVDVESVASAAAHGRWFSRRYSVTDLKRARLCRAFGGVQPRTVYNLYERPLGIFAPCGRLRLAVAHVLDSEYFDIAVLAVIGLNVCVEILDIPSLRGTAVHNAMIRKEVEVAFLLLFTIEMVLRSVGMGFALHAHAYLRDPWNVIDFLIVLLGYVSLLASGSNLAVVRLVRLARPLRAIRRVRGLRVLVNTIASALPMMVDVLMMLLLVMYVFAILGVQLFVGTQHQRCYLYDDFNTTDRILVQNDTSPCGYRTCASVGGMNISCAIHTSGVTDTDHYSSSVLTFNYIYDGMLLVFKVVTMDDWPDDMHNIQDGASFHAWLYFVALTVLGGYFCLNLVLAILAVVHSEHERKRLSLVRRQVIPGSEIPNGCTYAERVEAGIARKRWFQKLDEEDRMKGLVPTKRTRVPNHETHKIANRMLLQTFASIREQTFSSLKDGAEKKTNHFDERSAVKRAEERELRRSEEDNTIYIPRELNCATLLGVTHFHRCALLAIPHLLSSQIGGCDSSSDDDCSDAVSKTDTVKSVSRLTLTKDRESTYHVACGAGIVTLRGKLSKLVRHDMFEAVMLLVTVVNVLMMASDHHGAPPGLEQAINQTNFICSIFFLVEMVLKVGGLGAKLYFSDTYNILDFTLVLLSIPELIRIDSSMQAFVALRAFRGFRLMVRIPRQDLQSIIEGIVISFRAALYLMLLMLLLILIYALLGLSLFETTFTVDERENFRSLWEAAVSVFVIITGEGWCTMMKKAMDRTTGAAFLYFISLFCLGHLVLVNLFVAILIMNMAEWLPSGKQDDDSSPMTSPLSSLKKLGSRLPGPFFKRRKGMCEADYTEPAGEDTPASPVVAEEPAAVPEPEERPEPEEKAAAAIVSPETASVVLPAEDDFTLRNVTFATNPISSAESSPRFADWHVCVSKSSKRPFWWHPATGDRRWHPPAFHGTTHTDVTLRDGELRMARRLRPFRSRPVYHPPPEDGCAPDDVSMTSGAACTSEESSMSTSSTYWSSTVTSSECTLSTSACSKAEDGVARLGFDDACAVNPGLRYLRAAATERSKGALRAIWEDGGRGRMRLAEVAGQCAAFQWPETPGQQCENAANPIPSLFPPARRPSLKPTEPEEEPKEASVNTEPKEAEPKQKQPEQEDPEPPPDDELPPVAPRPSTERARDELKTGKSVSFMIDADKESEPVLAPLRSPGTEALDVIQHEKHAEDIRITLQSGNFAPRSLGLFSKSNPIRVALSKVVMHPRFDDAMILIIVMNAVCLALDDYHAESRPGGRELLESMNIVFVAIFLVEMVAKIIVMGLLGMRCEASIDGSTNAYLMAGSADEHSDVGHNAAWNRIDCVVAICGLLDLCGVPVVNALRCMRTLRILLRFENLRVVVKAMLRAMPSIGAVAVVCMFVFLVFGILGVSLFKGRFFGCNDATVLKEADCVGSYTVTVSNLTSAADTTTAERKWVNFRVNFDHLGEAILTLFQVSIGEAWAEIMWRAVDVTGVSEGPVRNNNPPMLLFFVMFVVVGNFFCINLFVGTLINNFNRDMEDLHTDAQKKEDRLSRLRSLYSMAYIAPRPKHWIGAICHDVVKTNTFTRLVISLILLNCALLGTQHYGQRELQTDVMHWMNVGFVVMFTLEACVKMCGLTLGGYFRDPWNRFDFACVVVSIFGVVFTSVNTGFIRVARIGRMFRLVRQARRLQMLFQTLLRALPSMGNIMLLLLYVFFNWGVIGVGLFKDVRPNDLIGRHFDFRTLPAAMVVLYSISTTEGWTNVMQGTTLSPPDCDHAAGDCGPGRAASIIYFVSFMIVGGLIFINLFIFVVLNTFENHHLEMQAERNAQAGRGRTLHKGFQQLQQAWREAVQCQNVGHCDSDGCPRPQCKAWKKRRQEIADASGVVAGRDHHKELPVETRSNKVVAQRLDVDTVCTILQRLPEPLWKKPERTFLRTPEAAQWLNLVRNCGNLPEGIPIHPPLVRRRGAQYECDYAEVLRVLAMRCVGITKEDLPFIGKPTKVKDTTLVLEVKREAGDKIGWVLDGVHVEKVAPYGPAAAAGMTPGMRLTRINDTAVKSAEEVAATLRGALQGFSVTVVTPVAWEEACLDHYIGARRIIRLWREKRKRQHRDAQKAAAVLESRWKHTARTKLSKALGQSYRRRPQQKRRRPSTDVAEDSLPSVGRLQFSASGADTTTDPDAGES